MEERFYWYIRFNRSHTQYARDMRKRPTLAEEKMWEDILKHKPCWYKFLRQKPIWPFIADFYCAKLSLIIELDGDIHIKTEHYDEQRTTFLVNEGISVIRYWNREVIETPDMVYKDLLDFIREFESKQKLHEVPLMKGDTGGLLT